MAKQLAMKSIRFELNPVGALVSRVKTPNYRIRDKKELEESKIPLCFYIPNVFEKYELKIMPNLFSEEDLGKNRVTQDGDK